VTDDYRDVLEAMLWWAADDAALRERHRQERHEHDQQALALVEHGRTLGLKFDLMGLALTPPGRCPRSAQALASFTRAQRIEAEADLRTELCELLEEGSS
jgi:hypothetical protein